MDRPQRDGRGRKTDKLAAIAKLREAKEGGKKRSEQYTVSTEAPIYEEVNDDHYDKIREVDNFVVDEGTRSAGIPCRSSIQRDIP